MSTLGSPEGLIVDRFASKQCPRRRLSPGAFTFIMKISMAKNINISKLKGTEFQKKVWTELTKIKKGTVVTYKELAKKVGRPLAVRAVANAVGANPCAPEIPCHRVVRSDGSLGGYSGRGGIKTKRKLLEVEGVSL